MKEFRFLSLGRTHRRVRAFSAFCFESVRSCPNEQASELRDSVRGRGRVLDGWAALTLLRGMVCFQETLTRLPWATFVSRSLAFAAATENLPMRLRRPTPAYLSPLRSFSDRITTRIRISNIACLCALTAVLSGVSEVQAAPPSATAGTSIMRVSEVQPHMKGYAVTVFEGTQSDRFDIELIDVVPDFSTGMDVVLFRALDPRLEHSGIVAGMSGSPVYINGKLLGAIAYGYSFNKDPVGGITPIETMLEIDRLPYRPDVQIRAGRFDTPGTQSFADQVLDPMGDPLFVRQRPQDVAHRGSGLAPIGATLGLSGFGHRSMSYLAETLGLPPVRGGSGRRVRPDAKSSPAKKKQWKPGDSISVVMIAGDNAAASNGTVSWVGGPNQERLLAYGHPMRGTGASELPIADAHVHVIISSVQRSFKMSSPLTIQGTMVQDRQPAIAARTNVEAPMIDVETIIRGPEQKLAPRSYHNQVAVHPDMTAALIASILMDAVEEAGSDATEVIVKTTHDIEYEAHNTRRNIKVEESTFFPAGADGRVIGRARALMAISAILYNDFEIGKIHRVRQSIEVQYGAPAEVIEDVRLRSSEIRAGELVDLEIILKNRVYGGKRRLPAQVRIPRDCAGETIAIEVAGGDWVRPQLPVANSIHAVVDSLTASYPERSIVLSVTTPEEGLATPHGLMDQLPNSVLETLSTRGGTEKKIRFKHVARRVLPQRTFISGSHSFQIDVLAPRQDAPN